MGLSIHQTSNSVWIRFIKNLIPLLIFMLSFYNSKAEIRKDTLVNVAWRDTFKLRKAQVYDLDSTHSMLFYHPKPFAFALNVPSDLYQLAKAPFQRKNLTTTAALCAGTLFLIAIDQQVTDAAQQFGRFTNLDPARKSKTAIELKFGDFNVDVLDLPQNVNSAMYFLGEGWPSILIASGFYGYGLVANDYRALQTTSQLAEMFFTLAIATQFLKRVTGRQSPFRATQPGGVWHPFTPPAIYQNNVSYYDAFPSGHMATAMATVTILAGNYPDNKFIKPVGYTLMGLLGYSMLNNGVHWLSDYPFAIAIGYTCGRIALSRGSQKILKPGTESGSSRSLTPIYMGQGNIGLCYRVIF
jgi:membrane-associated phospholipid phosphatase